MKKAIAILCVICIACALLAGCGDKTTVGGIKTRSEVQSTELQFTGVKDGDTVAVIHTTMGDIWVVLYPDYAPMAVDNFVGLAQKGYYNNNLVTRVAKDFLVQAGDATNTGLAGETVWGNTPFPIEVTDKLHHYAGALCMSQDTPGAGNLSQFYIISADSKAVDDTMVKALQDAGYSESVINTYKDAGGAPYLDYQYTVFGQVFDGIDVVDAINAAELDENARPLTAITITGIESGVYPFTPAADSSAESTAP